MVNNPQPLVIKELCSTLLSTHIRFLIDVVKHVSNWLEFCDYPIPFADSNEQVGHEGAISSRG